VTLGDFALQHRKGGNYGFDAILDLKQGDMLTLGDFVSDEVSRLTQEKQQPTFHMSGTKNFTLVKQ
jgi:hypothetical protein